MDRFRCGVPDFVRPKQSLVEAVFEGGGGIGSTIWQSRGNDGELRTHEPYPYPESPLDPEFGVL